MRLLAALVLLAGCDQVFGLTDAKPDAPGLDAPAMSITCPPVEPSTCRTVPLVGASDTYLTSADPDVIHGGDDALIANDVDPVLIKFDITGVRQGTECLAGLELVLQHQPTAKACSPARDTCATCPLSLETAELHWLTTDWSQGTATYRDRDTAMPWLSPGAAAEPDDRSATVATSAAITGESVVILVKQPQLAAIDITPYLSASRLAVLVLAQGGTGAFATHRGSACTNPGPPTAILTLCPTP